MREKKGGREGQREGQREREREKGEGSAGEAGGNCSFVLRKLCLQPRSTCGPAH